MKAGIINLNSGNLFKSFFSAVEKCGLETTIIDKPSDDFDVLVMPGQGRFGFICEQLDKHNWRDFIREWIAQGKRFVGVCVGMQVFVLLAVKKTKMP